MSELVRETEGFVIDTDKKAEWAMQKIREARADRDRLVEWYKEKTKEIIEQTEFDVNNLERMLAEYFETVPHKKSKTQESYSLPGGKLILKKQNPEFKRDEAKVIEWAKVNGCNKYVKVEEKLAWAELKADVGVFGDHVVTEDGEIVPGIEVIERPAEFKVEV